MLGDTIGLSNREENLKFLLPIKVKKWLKIGNETLSCVNAKVGWWKDTPN